MFLTIRHFHDENALKSFGQNGPLKPNQWELLHKTKENIEKILSTCWRNIVKILTDTHTNRLSETTNMLAEELKKDWIVVSIQDEARLHVMDQWDLILPDDYKDWEWFTPLDVARDAICDESYHNNNLFYRFWDHLNGKYPLLKDSFSRTGESMWRSLMNKYSLIYDLIHNKFTKDNETLLLVAQSDMPLLLMELKALEKELSVTPANLPYKCWEIYKSWLQETMYDKSAIWDGNFDIPMWYVGNFDLSSFVKNWFDQIIYKASLLLNKKYNEQKQDSSSI